MFLIEPDKGNNYFFYLIHPPFIFYPFQFFSNPYIMRKEDLPG